MRKEKERKRNKSGNKKEKKNIKEEVVIRNKQIQAFFAFFPGIYR